MLLTPARDISLPNCIWLNTRVIVRNYGVLAFVNFSLLTIPFKSEQLDKKVTVPHCGIGRLGPNSRSPN